ncbi:MAG: choline monooxygenase [Pseudonocardiales bacterium]|nr:choline monooxygenase [Pseudonocardiales bacterium]
MITQTARTGSGPLDGRAAGRSILPTSAYTDQDAFDAELRDIFEQRWVWAGFAHWVAAPGSSRPVSVAGRPLLLARDSDATLRVFHNICRHRGIVLSEEPSSRRRLRCPYHHWTFNLDGSLCGTPYWDRTKSSGPDEETRAQLGLLPVRHAVWAGMIFVHLGSPAEPAEDLLAPLADRWAPYNLDDARLAEERRYDIDANWKLVVENFLDFYHLPFVHPQVGSASVALDVEDEVLSPEIIGACYPRGVTSKASGLAGSAAGVALPLLGDIPEAMLTRQDIFCVFPNALVFLEPDFFQVIAYQPVAPDRTVEHMAVFFAAAAGADEYAEARASACRVLFEVNDQDIPILARLQRGRRSPRGDRNHLVPHWDQITARFQTLVAETGHHG